MTTTEIINLREQFGRRFRVEHLEQIAVLLRLRRRRQVSEEERRRLAEIGRAHQFRALAS